MSQNPPSTSDVRHAPGDDTRTSPVDASSRRCLLVALSGGSEDATLVRAAHRLAERDALRWCAIHVDTGRDTPERRLMLERAFAMTTRLGGETRELQGQDRATELLEYARQQPVSTLLVGCSRPSAWRIWRRTLAEQLLRQGGTFDLVVVAEARQRPRFRPRRQWQPIRFKEPFVALAGTLSAVVVAWGLESWLELANLSLVFLAAVLASAALAGTRAAMLSAVLGFLAFNFFFTQPHFTLVMGEREQLLTVIFFLLVAVVVGQLAGSGRRRLIALRTSREQTHRLLSYARALSSATDHDQVCDIGITTLESWLGVPVVFLGRDTPSAELRVQHAAPPGRTLESSVLTAANWSWQQGKASGRGTAELPDQRWRWIPLVKRGQVLGIVGLELAVRDTPLEYDQEALIEALASQLALALERTRLVNELGTARLAEENERLRSALLSSVSHDLRTPLSSIIGAASTLHELAPQLSQADRHELLDGILSESERLDRYIQNLLDMTRLGQGELTLERDWIALDDLVAEALRRLGPALEGLSITCDWPDDLPLLHVHPALIEQALVNVIDNAARFSPPNGRIHIEARPSADNRLEIRVTDEGPGIPPDMRQAVFDMFFTGGEGDRGRYGSGLGLAISRGMLGAHGGDIVAAPGYRGIGTTIVMHLPVVTVAASETPHDS